MDSRDDDARPPCAVREGVATGKTQWRLQIQRDQTEAAVPGVHYSTSREVLQKKWVLDINGWETKDRKAPPLQMLEDGGDFLRPSFGVIAVTCRTSWHRRRLATTVLRCHRGMLGNFEGVLGAIGVFYGAVFVHLTDVHSNGPSVVWTRL